MKKDLEPEDMEEICIATVSEVTTGGLKLVIDGEETAADKLYKCNNSVIYNAGDRVKFSRISGSILVDYVIGYPSSDPADTHGIPAGGSKGQVLAKASATDYDVNWTTPAGLPAGGSAGQALTKKTGSDYDVQWSAISVDTIASSAYSIKLDAAVLTPQGTTGTISLGSSSKKFKDLYAAGSVYLCDSNGKLGFFGHAVANRQTVANSATVSTLITALKAYGLIA